MKRAEYLAASLSRTRPWEAAGVSRASWYRHRRETGAAAETGALVETSAAETGLALVSRIITPSAALLRLTGSVPAVCVASAVPLSERMRAAYLQAWGGACPPWMRAPAGRHGRARRAG